MEVKERGLSRIMAVFFIVSVWSLCGCQVLESKRPQTPIMGWSSWNHFQIDINEELIRQHASAMVDSGMKEAGYQFINVDDGYFGGRQEDGTLICHPEKFPSGMKALADFIHSQGLKAGIYTAAGKDTCGSDWNKEAFG